MGLFSFGKKKKDVDEEYFPDSPDRTIGKDIKEIQRLMNTSLNEERFFSIDFISVCVAKLFRNGLCTFDKLTSIEEKIDKVLQENYKLQERNKQLEDKIENLAKSR